MEGKRSPTTAPSLHGKTRAFFPPDGVIFGLWLAAVSPMAMGERLAIAGQPQHEAFSQFLLFPHAEFSQVGSLEPDPEGSRVRIASDWRWGRLYFQTRDGTGYQMLVSQHDNPWAHGPCWNDMHMKVTLVPSGGPFAGKEVVARCLEGGAFDECSFVFSRWSDENGYVEDYARLNGDPDRRVVEFRRVESPNEHRYLVSFDDDDAKVSAHPPDSGPAGLQVQGEIELLLDETPDRTPLQWYGDTQFFWQMEDIFDVYGDGRAHSYMYQQFGRVVGGSILIRSPLDTTAVRQEVDPDAPSFAYLEKQPKSLWEPFVWRVLGGTHDYVNIRLDSGIALSFVFDYFCTASRTKCYPDYTHLPISFTYRHRAGGSHRVPVVDGVGGDLGELLVHMTHEGYYPILIEDESPSACPGKHPGELVYMPLEYRIWSPGGVLFGPGGEGIEVPAFDLRTERITPVSELRTIVTSYVARVSGWIREDSGDPEGVAGHAAIEQTQVWILPEEDPYRPQGPIPPEP